MTGNVRRVVLVCTALHGAGGTSRHMARIWRMLDRSRYRPYIVFASRDAAGLREFFSAEGCSADDIFSVPVLAQDPWDALTGLRRTLAVLKPDIVHSFFLHSDILVCLVTAWQRSLVRISSVEGKFIWDRVNDVGRFKSGAYRFLNRLIRGMFRMTVTVSDDLKREVLGAGADPRRVRVVPVGLDVPQAGALAPVQAGTARVVACMARFAHDKGVDLFVRIVSRLAAEWPQVRFIAAGAGPDETALRALTKELGIDGRIEFSGWVRDVTAFMNSVDVFVMPSRREGCPLALIEAMLHARAVVAFDVPGVNEIVRDGENARVVAAFDVEAAALAAGELIGDERLRRDLGDAARSSSIEMYALAREAEAWALVYGERRDE